MFASRIAISLLLFAARGVLSFAPPPLTHSSFQGTPLVVSKPPPSGRRTCTSLSMFLGSEGGFLGVGAPEVFTILLVGYFVLGPSDLYKLVKELGKGITNLRTLSADVTKTFETNMESQLQLDDLRKAQRELNDAFSFRRSINVDDEVAFNEISTTTASATTDETAASSTAADADNGAATRKRKKRRVKKKKEMEPEADLQQQQQQLADDVPDLEMPLWSDALIREEEERALRHEEEEEEMERMRREQMERLQSGGARPFADEGFGLPPSDEQTPEERERFAQQLSGNWNEMILASEDKLSPLSKIMERLAILEEEKKAADARLEEEFRLRTGVEEKYYREKRAILEEAAAEVQAKAYVSSLDDNNKTV